MWKPKTVKKMSPKQAEIVAAVDLADERSGKLLVNMNAERLRAEKELSAIKEKMVDWMARLYTTGKKVSWDVADEMKEFLAKKEAPYVEPEKTS